MGLAKGRQDGFWKLVSLDYMATFDTLGVLSQILHRPSPIGTYTEHAMIHFECATTTPSCDRQINLSNLATDVLASDFESGHCLRYR
jgi:hypothetical protein